MCFARSRVGRSLEELLEIHQRSRLPIQGVIMSRNLFHQLCQLAFGKQAGRKSKNRPRRKGRSLQIEGLEKRDLFSVSSLWFDGKTLIVQADDNATSVSVSQTGSKISVKEVGTDRVWDYQDANVDKVQFQGGDGNDRFVNYVANMPVRAFGGDGNDYLEGYNGADELIGGGDHDTLVGFGGNDYLWGGDGEDVLRGGAGVDRLQGGAHDDYLDGGADKDYLWGEHGNDTLLGGTGDDELMGGDHSDRLNGQAGKDKLWGDAGNDVLISLDAAFADYLDGGANADTFWVDQAPSTKLPSILGSGVSIPGVTDSLGKIESSDVVQKVVSFSNGADRTLDGDSNIQDPKDSGKTRSYRNEVKAGNTEGIRPLFGSNGPVMEDIEQRDLADCYLLGGLGAIARDNPNVVRQNVVDFDDGTYGVRLGNSFYRVDGDLPVKDGNGAADKDNVRYAGLGTNSSMWVAIVEKAFAHYLKGDNKYSSLEWNSVLKVSQAFRSNAMGTKAFDSYGDASAMANDIAARSAGRQSVTVSISGNKKVTTGKLVTGHVYIVASVKKNSAGTVTSITLRNPWGGTDALVTVSASTLYKHAGSVNWGRV